MSAVPDYEVVVAQTAEEIAECFNVRVNVFITEQGFDIDTEKDQYDDNPSSAHILLRVKGDSEIPVGTIRCTVFTDGSYYKLSRLAVLKDYRQYKFGRALVLALHDFVKSHAKKSAPKEQEYATIVCHSQIPVMPFYAKYGYISEGPEFSEDGSPHRKMIHRLSLRDD